MLKKEDVLEAVLHLGDKGMPLEGYTIKPVEENGDTIVCITGNIGTVHGSKVKALRMPLSNLYENTSDLATPEDAAAEFAKAARLFITTQHTFPRDYSQARQRLFLQKDPADMPETKAISLDLEGFRYHVACLTPLPGGEMFGDAVSGADAEDWSVNMDDVVRDATRNTLMLADIHMKNMTNFTNGSPDIYSFTDAAGLLGAGALFFPGLARQISRKLGGNFTAFITVEEGCMLVGTDNAFAIDLVKTIIDMDGTEKGTKLPERKVLVYDTETDSFHPAPDIRNPKIRK